MEAAYRSTEMALFYNIDSTSYPAASVPGGYPADPMTSPNDSVARVNGNGHKMGPALLLKVMSGDSVAFGVKSFYRSGGSVGSPNNSLQTVLTSLATGLVGISAGTHGVLSDLNNSAGSPVYAALNSFLPANDPATVTTPKAYLNWMLLDNQFNYVSGNDQSGAVPVGSPDVLNTLAKSVGLHHSGYLYIWVSNETPGWDVFFDNLSVQTFSGPMLEENHYYPFGLQMSGLCDRALKTNYTQNKHLFNGGNELQNKEFSDGSGLELYDAKNRMYDPQIGRFGQIDALGDMSHNISPYTFASNNPISINDPLGLSDSLPTVTVVGYIKNKASEFTNWFTGAGAGYTGSGWGHGPRRALAGLLNLGNNANNLFELGLQSQLQNSHVNLTGGLLNGLKTDPAMAAFQNKIIALLKS